MKCLCLFLVVACATPAVAQVFTVNPAAGSGQTGSDNEARYGSFGLDSANNPAYDVYRKYGERDDPSLEGTAGAAVDGNDSAMTWTGMYHSGGTGIIDPGMWIGTSAATSSPADQLLYFRPAIDEEGGGVDDNSHRDWDLRFGFLEDPQSFIDSREPNGEGWDLWSGEWDTDGVSAQVNIGSSEFNDESDWYVRRSGFRLNAKESVFAHEGNRDAVDWDEVIHPGSGDEVEPFDANNNYAGVDYEDPIEISWKLEPIDGSREVQFSVKVGNSVQIGTFDPGADGDPVEPNSGDGEEYSDGFFDWQNATPVFFVAPTGGGEASGSMGVFIPGDVNADGTVDAADRARLESFIGQVDTTYSRGDLDQDGDTDADDLALFDTLGDPLAGLNGLTGGERVDYVHDVLGTWMGDSNLDGEFNSSDMVFVFSAGEYEDAVDGNSDWSDGDWDGNGDFNSADFVAAFADGGYEQGPRAATAAVPEPVGFGLMLFAGASLLAFRRR